VAKRKSLEERSAELRAKNKIGEDALELLAATLGITEDEFKRDEEDRPLRLMCSGRYVHVRDDVVALIIEKLNAKKGS